MSDLLKDLRDQLEARYLTALADLRDALLQQVVLDLRGLIGYPVERKINHVQEPDYGEDPKKKTGPEPPQTTVWVEKGSSAEDILQRLLAKRYGWFVKGKIDSNTLWLVDQLVNQRRELDGVSDRIYQSTDPDYPQTDD